MFVCYNSPQNSILASAVRTKLATPLLFGTYPPCNLPSLQFQHLNVSKYLAKMLLPGQKTRGQHNETLLHFRQSHANAHIQKPVLLLNTVTKQNIKNYNKWVEGWMGGWAV